MTLFIAGILLIAVSGLPGLCLSGEDRRGELLAEILALLGTATAGIGLWFSHALDAAQSVQAPWTIPGGELLLRIDALALVFLIPLLLVFAASVVFGHGYWPQTQHPENSRKLRLFHGLIAAGIAILLTAHNGILFLFAWEVMALASFFLITTEDEHEEVRRAGFIYLIATHVGTLALFALFILLDLLTGSFALPVAGTLAAGGLGTAIFLLGLFGFGLKAGIMPLHVWLPGAHAAAPSHISALLSGIMIKTGIYGLVRLTSLYHEIPLWWGWTLLVLGAITGILGVAYALAQHDLKRLLAYHSVENIGIIVLGLGLALIGCSTGHPALTVLGLAGALLHVINHALFKSLLFFSAGSVIHAIATRELDRMGGLLRNQPWTAIAFLGGAVAICGLPPFNGFISEWLIYSGSFRALVSTPVSVSLAVLVAPILALIGGLALACFVKVFGVIFLGTPRSEAAATAHEATLGMRGSMALLLLACLWIGLLPGTLLPLLRNAVRIWSPADNGVALDAALPSLVTIGLLGGLLLLIIVALTFWLHRREQGDSASQPTWGCGYPQPTSRIQYTASSLADFLVTLFRFGLWTEQHGGRPQGLFPKTGSFTSHTPDLVFDRCLLPIGNALALVATWLRRQLQNGVIGFYLLYVVLTLMVLLAMSIR